MPLRTVATSELVVPRSMPTARRSWCGAGDWPGSEICRSAMLELVLGRGDLLAQLLHEHQAAQRPGRLVPGLRGELRLDLEQQRPPAALQPVAQRRELRAALGLDRILQ